MPSLTAGITGGSALLGAFGSSGDNDTTVQQDPWSGQQPFLKDVFQQASNQYRSPGPQYYPGQTVAPFNADQLQGQQYTRDFARTSQPMIDQYHKSLQFAQGPVMDVANNPYVTGMADAVTNPIQKRLMEQILPSVRGAASQAGNQHSSRRGIMEGQAIGDTTEAMANARANVFGNAYNTGVGSFNNSFAYGPTGLSMGQSPGVSMGMVGAQGQQLAQNQMLDAQNRWDFTQNQPENRLSEYSRMIQGQYGSTTNTQPPPASPLAGAIGGGLMGYGMTQPGGPFAGWSPFGTAPQYNPEHINDYGY